MNFIFNTNNFASQPTPIELKDCIRIFYTFRDNDGLSRISFIDVDKLDPKKILYKHNTPILELGSPGSFDEHGIMMGEIIYHQNQYWLYYIGWQRSSTVPYITTLGLALSNDCINFEKVSEGPIIGLNKNSPFGIAKISILIEDNEFNMWYTHYNKWVNIDNQYRPNYDIRFSKSKDGLHFEFEEEPCILIKNKPVGAPCVKKYKDKYQMWFGYRENFNKGDFYKIGTAYSYNKLDWNIGEDLKINSNEDWDLEMQCYPNILNNYLFYSGNNYGKDGFGFIKI